MESSTKRLLVVDEQKGVRDDLAMICRRLGYKVATASNPATLKRKLEAFAPSIVLLDLGLPGQESNQSLKVLKNSGQGAKIILLCNGNSRLLLAATSICEVLGLDISGVLKKPVVIDTLRNMLRGIRPPITEAQVRELSIAIDKDEIRPAYQVKAVRLPDGAWSMSEVEALARWHQADSEIEYPGAFMSFVEDAGLLWKLTDSLLRQVAWQVADWEQRGLSMTAAINTPVSLLTETTFPSRLEALMKKHSLENDRLTLEVTESAAMQEPGPASNVLKQLRRKGFGLAIDNCGVGYLSVTKLHQLHFDELKIDRFLVREVGLGMGGSKIVEAMILLGKNLDMSVCAEGVESGHVLKFLLDSGCDKIQGFFLGRPASASEVEIQVRDFARNGFPNNPRPAGRNGTKARSSLPILCL